MNRFATLDFGTGFYTTTNEAQAAEFAVKTYFRRTRTGGPTVNEYEVDWDEVKRLCDVLVFPEYADAGCDFAPRARNRRAGNPKGAIVSRELRYLAFATEYYRNAHGLTGRELADLFSEHDTYQLILDNCYLYHIESPDHMVVDID